MNMSTKKNLRRKIENYPSKIEFRNIDSALYIIPETLSFDMLENLISARNDVEYLRQNQKDDVAVINAAEIMRGEMKSSSSHVMSWPPTSDELSFENINIEHYTGLFFNKLLSGETRNSENSRVNRLKLSFSPDLLYAVTNGRVKTIKSILYSSVIKSLSNNTDKI